MCTQHSGKLLIPSVMSDSWLILTQLPFFKVCLGNEDCFQFYWVVNVPGLIFGLLESGLFWWLLFYAVQEIWTIIHFTFNTWQSFKLSPFPWTRKGFFCIWNLVFKKMLMGLTAVKNINCKINQIYSSQKGKMEVVTMGTGGAQETRWLCAEIPTKIFNPILGLSIGMSGNWSRTKTQGRRRRSAVEARGCGQKFVQLEAGWVKVVVSPWCPAAGGTGSHGSMLSSNPF